MNNGFYSILKTLFILKLKMFSFLSWLFCFIGKQLDKKAKVNLKSYDVTNWNAVITMNILPGILKSKRYQTMKLGWLREYNVRNIFL